MKKTTIASGFEICVSVTVYIERVYCWIPKNKKVVVKNDRLH